jgi:hypothetical protein
MRKARPDVFNQRVRQLRTQHGKKVSLVERLERLGL